MPLDAVSLVQALAADGDDVEGMLVVGLDHERHVCGVAINPRHRALSFMKVWELEACCRSSTRAHSWWRCSRRVRCVGRPRTRSKPLSTCAPERTARKCRSTIA